MVDPDHLTPEEIARIRVIIEADHAAKLTLALMRRIAGWIAGVLATLYIVWKIGLDIISLKGGH